MVLLKTSHCLRLVLALIFATGGLFGCAKTSQSDTTSRIQSETVQYTAKVDSSQDGCGRVLCADDESGLCAFPKGIPDSELLDGAVFWVQGSFSTAPSSADANACMGLVRSVIEVQTYRRLN